MRKTLAAISALLAVTSAVEPIWAQSRSRLAGQQEAREPDAIAKMINARGQEVGEAALFETPHGVLIEVDLRNYTNRQHVLPGVHAFHIHALGRCDPPDFKAIGEHYNPTARQHGVLNPEGMHVGDLLNLHMPVGQAQHFEVLAAYATLGPGDNSLFDADGSILVIHEHSDDYRTDPTGNAGGAVACGVIEPPETE
jgi:superoxide dismutase, Cu-Zn family